MSGLDFSFSGIKTAVLYFLRDRIKEDPDFIAKNLQDIAASIQFRLINMLMAKLIQASEEKGISEIALAGGVSANRGLRNRLMEIAAEKEWNIYIPEFEYCTDNAGMIAIAAHYKFLNQEFCGLEVAPLARMPLS